MGRVGATVVMLKSLWKAENSCHSKEGHTEQWCTCDHMMTTLVSFAATLWWSHHTRACVWFKSQIFDFASLCLSLCCLTCGKQHKVTKTEQIFITCRHFTIHQIYKWDSIMFSIQSFLQNDQTHRPCLPVHDTLYHQLIPAVLLFLHISTILIPN